LFKFSFFNKAEKIHFFIKLDQLNESALAKYEIISFQSGYLDCLSKIMKQTRKCYFGFDALHFDNESHRIQLGSLKEQLGEFSQTLGSSLCLKRLDTSMWSCVSSKVKREKEPNSEEDSACSNSNIIEEDSKAEEVESKDSLENLQYRAVDEVSLLCFYHFCEKPTPAAYKGNFVRRIRNLLLFRNKGSIDKQETAEEEVERKRKGKLKSKRT
jgi:hypothetical protein